MFYFLKALLKLDRKYNLSTTHKTFIACQKTHTQMALHAQFAHTQIHACPHSHANTQTHKLTHTDTHIHMHTHDVICVAREQTTNYFTICVYYVKKHLKKIN